MNFIGIIRGNVLKLLYVHFEFVLKTAILLIPHNTPVFISTDDTTAVTKPLKPGLAGKDFDVKKNLKISLNSIWERS